MPAYDILTLEICDDKVEEIRFFGSSHIKATVEEFKKVYNLTIYDDYIFYLTMQSKMNKFKH